MIKERLDIILFCPECGEQHVDEAKPDICERCGVPKEYHALALVPSQYGHVCDNFTAWLNPPHKSHRCHGCNTVWRPADFCTNGVAMIETRGESDTVIFTSPI